MIDIRKLGCKSGHRYLLRDATWHVSPGDHWLVFGPNGSGKTTLLSIIAGYRQHTEGTLAIFGAPLDNTNVVDVRKRIGFVSASFFGRFYNNESALSIVLSGTFGTFGVDGEVPLDTLHRALALLAEFNLEDRADYPFHMFSKGEQQNILIARALINHPDVLILDEPCTGLDVYYRESLFKTIEQLGRRPDLAIIYVTHYVEEIMPLFDKALLLRGGLVYRQGATEELFTTDVFARYYDYPTTVSRTEQGGYRLSIASASHLADLVSEGGF